MVTGDVTISASPTSAILGAVITFTGRVLLDGVPAAVGITIYLDTAPAPPTTIASGDTDANGYYHIHWTSNYRGSLPIYAHAAAYQGFTSPTIIVPIVEAGVEVHLEPRLHNALLEFRYRSYGLDELLYTKLSVLGRTEWPQGGLTSYDIFQVRFPPQTVNGAIYNEARTPTFMYQAAPHVFTLTLEEVPYDGVYIHLQPALNGALLELHDRSYGGDVIVDTKLAVNGEAFFDGSPYIDWYVYEVRFPPQIIGGISYLEALTPWFNFEYPREYTLSLQEAPVGIPTTTTISAPSKAAVDEKFFVSGILYETESGIPIPSQPINHSYNGRSLGSSTTGVDGDYLKEVSIPEAGTWTIKSEFPGTEALQTSRALADAVVGEISIETPLLIAGSIITGLVLIIYGSI